MTTTQTTTARSSRDIEQRIAQLGRVVGHLFAARKAVRAQVLEMDEQIAVGVSLLKSTHEIVAQYFPELLTAGSDCCLVDTMEGSFGSWDALAAAIWDHLDPAAQLRPVYSVRRNWEGAPLLATDFCSLAAARECRNDLARSLRLQKSDLAVITHYPS